MADEIDTSEFQFKGRHADYVRKLTSEIDTSAKFKIFQYNVDVLIFAPIVGMIYGRKSDVDNDNSINPIKINFQQLTKRSSALDYNKELILLLNKKDSIDVNERINKAFRYLYDEKEENREKKEKCEEEYLEYVLGGVVVLYEKIMEYNSPRNIEDYIDNLFEFVTDIKERASSVMSDDELYNLCLSAENKQV